MIRKLTLLATIFFLSSPSWAWISEEIDDHYSSVCVGDDLNMTVTGNKMTGTAIDLNGQKYKLSGELNSLTIDTEDSSLHWRVILDDNELNVRYLTVKSVDGVGSAALHYNISKVAGSLGEVTCDVTWISQLEKDQ